MDGGDWDEAEPVKEMMVGESEWEEIGLGDGELAKGDDGQEWL